MALPPLALSTGTLSSQLSAHTGASVHQAPPSRWAKRQQELSVIASTNTLYEGVSGRLAADLRDAAYGVAGLGQ